VVIIENEISKLYESLVFFQVSVHPLVALFEEKYESISDRSVDPQ